MIWGPFVDTQVSFLHVLFQKKSVLSCWQTVQTHFHFCIFCLNFWTLYLGHCSLFWRKQLPLFAPGNFAFGCQLPASCTYCPSVSFLALCLSLCKTEPKTNNQTEKNKTEPNFGFFSFWFQFQFLIFKTIYPSVFSVRNRRFSVKPN